MQPKRNILKLWKLVQRENAARFMLISLMSFVATVMLVRTFLVLTGYPQIGSGSLHIAHVLWGGLILYIAAILPLIYLNPRLHYSGAILSGVGVGLFIDEVGKFITSEYDYFFPAAAPIMYVFFLLVIILMIMVNRPQEEDGRTELVQALEVVREQLYRPLELIERARFEQGIQKVLESDPNPLHSHLARHLLEYLRADERVVPESMPAWWMRFGLSVHTWLTEARLSRWLAGGMLILSLLMFKNPFQVWLQRYIPGSAVLAFLNTHFGRQIDSITAPTLFNIRIWLEVGVGILLLIATGLMIMKKYTRGITIAFFSLLLSLSILDMLLFYFEQFSAVLTVLFQFALLYGVMHYRRKYLHRRI